MLIPLKQFYCDTCGEIINRPEEGYTEWIDEEGYCNGFKIIHHKLYSPLNNKECSQYINKKGIIDGSLSLDRMISLGASKLLTFLNDGDFTGQYTRSRVKEKHLQNFTDFFSRLTIPYYEEARKHFNEAESQMFCRKLCGMDIYDPSTLEKIVRKFSMQ